MKLTTESKKEKNLKTFLEKAKILYSHTHQNSFLNQILHLQNLRYFKIYIVVVIIHIIFIIIYYHYVCYYYEYYHSVIIITITINIIVTIIIIITIFVILLLSLLLIFFFFGIRGPIRPEGSPFGTFLILGCCELKE